MAFSGLGMEWHCMPLARKLRYMHMGKASVFNAFSESILRYVEGEENSFVPDSSQLVE
jgi:hypothetical protein